jgi:hypothetical protein
VLSYGKGKKERTANVVGIIKRHEERRKWKWRNRKGEQSRRQRGNNDVIIRKVDMGEEL